MDAAISIHAPVKGATSKRAAAETARQFQSTLPRRERLAKLRNPSIFSRFQSTLSRRERRKSAAVRPAESQISIHAPAKGATIEPRILTFAVRYFNPRSREGSDMYKASIMLSERHFNPRSREGSDDEHPRICKRTDDFNPRSREGSDGTLNRAFRVSKYFNPRSREGSDAASTTALDAIYAFQSTLP